MQSAHIWILVLILAAAAESLKLTQVVVDRYPLRGGTAVLRCDFDLEGARYLDVDWLKDGVRFLKYSYMGNPPYHVFPVPGVSLDISRSNESHVTLKDLSLASTGSYRCEVTVGSPNFHNISVYGHLITVALPEKGSRISGGQSCYQVGDTVKVNCTSGYSKPVARLAWIVNGEKANDEWVERPTFDHNSPEGLDSMTLGMEFKVELQHLTEGFLRIQCLATIGTVYQNSDNVTAKIEESQEIPDVELQEEMLSTGSPTGSPLLAAQPLGDDLEMSNTFTIDKAS